MSMLTKTTPKSLVPIAGLTILERLINTLREAGVTSFTVGVGWLGEDICKHLQGLSGSEGIVCANVPNYERGPLETLVCSLEETTADTFLVCPADFMVESKLVSDFIREHEKSEDERILSLAVDPKGKQGSVVVGGKNGAFVGFSVSSKSSKDDLGRSVMLVAGGFDAKSLFKQTLQKGKTTVAEAITKMATKSDAIVPVKVEGYWQDIDTLDDMLDTLPYAISNASPNMSLSIQSGDSIEVGDIISMPTGTVLNQGVKIIGPVFIGRNSIISEGAVIGPRASLDENTHIPRECEIVNSILFNNPLLQEGTQIRDAIVRAEEVIHGVK